MSPPGYRRLPGWVRAVRRGKGNTPAIRGLPVFGPPRDRRPGAPGLPAPDLRLVERCARMLAAGGAGSGLPMERPNPVADVLQVIAGQGGMDRQRENLACG